MPPFLLKCTKLFDVVILSEDLGREESYYMTNDIMMSPQGDLAYELAANVNGRICMQMPVGREIVIAM